MTTAYPLSWPNGWPRTAPAARLAAKFHSINVKHDTVKNYDGTIKHRSWKQRAELSVHAAMRRLSDELDRLGAAGVILSCNLERRLDGQPYSNRAEPADPGVACYFRLKQRDAVLACDRWTRIADNIAAIAGHVSAMRAQQRWGVGSVEQAFAGYMALPPPGAVHQRPWREVLGAAASLDEAKAYYRQLARQRHPDSGGSHAQMAELNAAMAQAQIELQGGQ